MSIFRRKRANGKGKTIPDGVYTIEFRDHSGIVRRVSGSTDKSASREVERQLKRLVALRMAGSGPDADSTRFLECCQPELRERLGEWGMISTSHAKGGTPLSALVESWGAHLRAQEFGESHCRESVSCVRRVLRETGIAYWSEISADKIEIWLAELRKSGTSIRTSNSYLTKLKAFCNWMLSTGVATVNPLRFIRKLNEAADKRYERHPYTIEELGLVLAAAEAGGIIHGMVGSDRALLYRTAVETGFRWSECRSLTRASFNFESDPPTVTIRAEDTKNGKEATLPLRPGLATDLKARMALFLPAAKAFPGMWEGKGAEMIQMDLEAAGILRRDNKGVLNTTDEHGLVYDFHGLRHTFATLGAKAGIPLATMQKLMRHSDPKLTAGIYTHILVADKADELAKLPAICAAIPKSESTVLTGTDHASTIAPPIYEQVKKYTTSVLSDSSAESVKSTDRKMDRNGVDFNRQITTYSDIEKCPNTLAFDMTENQKYPVPQGQTGYNDDGGRYRIRTCDSLLVRQVL